MSTDKFSIKIGEGETRVTPFIKVSITNFPPLLKESEKGKLEVNPVYQSSLDFFRKKVESNKLKSIRDYEFVAVDKEVILTPLNESAWENLKPWKLSDEELLELWSNRNTE